MVNAEIAHELQRILTTSIEKVMENEHRLLLDRCSERAIVHWLANYFQQEAQKSNILHEYSDYTVDVEYNRVDQNGDPKEMLKCDGDACKYRHKDKCAKRYIEAETNALASTTPDPQYNYGLIDMIYHKRGTNSLEANLFCLEVKTTSTSTTDYRNMCDKKRVHSLVTNGGTTQYQFGAAIHICAPNKAEGIFYTHDQQIPIVVPPVQEGQPCAIPFSCVLMFAKVYFYEYSKLLSNLSS